jgi:pSer/pThr/pTyr-binding forkhead associated (FHA) protein
MAAESTLYFHQSNKSYDINPKRTLVAGTSETCTLILQRFLTGNTNIISRRHFKIEYVPGEGYTITDLASLNGTSINGQPLEPYAPRFLRDGDQIILANYHDFMIEVIITVGTSTEKLLKSESLSHKTTYGILSGIYFDAIYDQFIVDGQRVEPTYFSNTEHKALRYLAIQPGRVRSHDELAEHVWDGWVQNNTIAKTIGNIRRKLDATSPGAGGYIQTIHGRGFRCRIG